MSCESTEKKLEAKNKAAIETPKGKHSYAVGTDLAKRMDRIEVDLDLDLVLQAIKDHRDAAKTPLMNDSQIAVAWQELMTEIRNFRMAKDSAKAIENLALQTGFLSQNKGEANVIVTESGLQYMVITEGSGEFAKDGDTVSVHYAGSLLDGTEFDSSVKRNQPINIAFSENRLIKGWVEILRLMKKGQKVKVWIPANLGYGERGSPPTIPGNSLLIYEMELLDLKHAKK